MMILTNDAYDRFVVAAADMVAVVVVAAADMVAAVVVVVESLNMSENSYLEGDGMIDADTEVVDGIETASAIM